MGTGKIPAEIVTKAKTIIAAYNEATFGSESGLAYRGYARGAFFYIDRNEYGRDVKTIRLRFNESMDDWDFAIFKWSSERYSEDTFFMPGEEFIDGTIEGALKAADVLYPPPSEMNDQMLLQQLVEILNSKL